MCEARAKREKWARDRKGKMRERVKGTWGMGSEKRTEGVQDGIKGMRLSEFVIAAALTRC